MNFLIHGGAMRISNLPQIKNKAFEQLRGDMAAKIVETEISLRELRAQIARLKTTPVRADEVVSSLEERLKESKRVFTENLRNEISAMAFASRPKLGDAIMSVADTSSTLVRFGNDYECLALASATLILETAKTLAKEICAGGKLTFAEREAKLSSLQSEIVQRDAEQLERCLAIAQMAGLSAWAAQFEE